MLNEVNLIGNLGDDPDIKYTQAGDPVANLSLATTEKWKDKQSGDEPSAFIHSDPATKLPVEFKTKSHCQTEAITLQTHNASLEPPANTTRTEEHER